MARAVAGAWLKRGHFVAMIRDIRCPTLVVHGAEDPIVSPSAVKWLCSLRSDWELIVMEDTGHTPQLDAPVRFMGNITPWLRDRLI
jgi:pimeloyl-ACP methyl ester carboxylesterase